MAEEEPVKSLRVAPWKAVAVLAVLLLLTPVWVAYGWLGALLTRPSSKIIKNGLQLLAVLGLWVSLQIFRIKLEGEADDTGMKLVIAGWIVALLLAQWKMDQLLVFHLSQKAEERRINIAATAMLALILGTAAVLSKASLMVLSQGRVRSSYAMNMFWAIYLLLPVTVAISHLKIWIPARYAELERLERDIIERNVKVPFEMLKIAGLGTVHVPCTAPITENPKPPLVLLHGYAAGNALWACNFEDLSRHYDVYAIEWIGTGRSDRPQFTSYEWEYVNEIMVEALENWRKERMMDKFYLGGHSMGAMFASSYAVKYPERVEHLVLISPAGVGHPPLSKNLPLGLRIFRSVWNLRLTPMSVARYAGPLGPRFLHFIASVRVSVMPKTSCIHRGLIPLDALAAYWYNNWALEKSSEIAMHSHLLPGVYAKRPLCEILTPETIRIPITFIYGGGPDWMSSSHGEKMARTFEGKQSVEVLLVPGTGHQLFMDNAPAFNEMLLAALTRT